MEGEPGETVIPVEGDLVVEAQAGDRIVLVDARGKDRTLRVIEAADSYCVCDAGETAYVIPRTRLALRRHKHTVADAVVTEMPAVPEAIQLRSGDVLEIARGDMLGRPATLDRMGRTIEPAVVSCSLAEVFRSVRLGQRVFLDDGRISGMVRSAACDVLNRMEAHQSKKTPLLRKLKISDLRQAPERARRAAAKAAREKSTSR